MMAAPSFVSYDTGPNPFAALAQPPPMQPMHYPQPPSLPHPPSEPYPVRAPPPGIPKERISASSLPLLPWVSKDEPPSTTLEVYQNSEHVQTIVLDQSFVVLGRDGASGCNVVLKSSSASRCHAILGYDAADQRWYVMDQASTFGTLLDGKKLEAKKKCEVEDRSSLKFGEASSKIYTLKTRGRRRSRSRSPGSRSSSRSSSRSRSRSRSRTPPPRKKRSGFSEVGPS